MRERPGAASPPGQEARVPKLLSDQPWRHVRWRVAPCTVYTNLSSSLSQHFTDEEDSGRVPPKQLAARRTSSPVVHRRHADGIFQTTSMVAWGVRFRARTYLLGVGGARVFPILFLSRGTAGAGTGSLGPAPSSPGALWVWAPKTMRHWTLHPGTSPCTPEPGIPTGCHQGSNWGSVGGFGGDWLQDQGWRRALPLPEHSCRSWPASAAQTQLTPFHRRDRGSLPGLCASERQAHPCLSPVLCSSHTLRSSSSSHWQSHRKVRRSLATKVHP